MEKWKEWYPTVCLMCKAAPLTSDMVAFRIYSDAYLSVVLMITAQTRASRDQLRSHRPQSIESATCVTETFILFIIHSFV